MVNGARELLKDSGGQITEVASHGNEFNTALVNQPAMKDNGVVAVAGSVGAGIATPAVCRFDGTALTILTLGSTA
jgi:hypothetical protein